MRNTLVNGVANAANACITLALTPFLLHHLGRRQYGVWLLALSLTFSNGYLALGALGLPRAAVKFIAEARARNARRTVSEIASTTLVVFLVIGLLAGLAIVCLSSAIAWLFHLHGDLSRSARMVFTLIGLSVVLELPALSFLAVIEGTQRYGTLRAIDVGGRLVWATTVFVAVRQGHGVLALAGASLATTAVEGVAALWLARSVEPTLQLRLALVDRAVLRRLLSFGSIYGLMEGLATVYAQMDRLIIAVVIGAAAVAQYEVAYRLQSVAALVMVMSYSAVLPAAAHHAARGEDRKQRELFLRGTKYAVALIVPTTLATMILARPLIVTWIGPDYASLAGAARIFLVYPLFGCLNQIGVTMISGLGRLRPILRIQTIGVFANLVLSVALVRPLGLSGVILGTLLGNALTFAPYVRLQLATFGVDVRLWLHRIVVPNIPGVVAQLLATLLILRWAQTLHNLPAVGLAWALSCAISFAAFLCVGLQASERRNLMMALTRSNAASSGTM